MNNCYDLLNNVMISKTKWNEYIQKIHQEVSNKKEYNLLETSKQKIRNALEESIKNLPNRFGLCFSGGIDSAVIAILAKKYKKEFTCFCLFDKNSRDFAYAKKIAKDYNLKLIKINTINTNDAEIITYLQELMKILNTREYTKLSIGLVTYLCLKEIKKYNFKNAVTGLGSEEIFAGYNRHLKSNDINKECWNGLQNITFDTDFNRDLQIASFVRIKTFTPFLCRDLIKQAMLTKGSLKIKDGIKKYILRVIAEDIGLKHEYAFRKKLAAQYGSSIDKRLTKIAKKFGYKYKSDLLTSI